MGLDWNYDFIGSITHMKSNIETRLLLCLIWVTRKTMYIGIYVCICIGLKLEIYWEKQA